MAKLGVNKYYTKDGNPKVNSYFVSVPKSVVAKAGFTKDTLIKVRAENGKIIVEEDK